MPRNSSGTYSLPTGNPVVAGTLIEANWANTTLTDIGSAITDSLSRTGEGAMTAAFRAFAGTVSAPGISFSAETSSGFYRAGSGNIRFSLAGVDKITITSAGMTLADALALASGGTGATTAAGARVNILPSYTSNALKVLRINSGGTDVEWAAAASGDVVGPASATNNAVALFDGTTGKLLKNSAATFDGSTFTLSSTTAYYPQLVTRNKTADANAAYYVFDKDRNGAAIQSGDVLGNVVFRGYDGTNYLQGASINAAVDGTPGTNDIPTKLVFATTADGASSPTERMSISNGGTVSLQNDYQEKAYTANTSTAYTIDITNGTVQILTLTGNCTFTFPTATAGKSFILLLKQDGTGSRTATWPAAVKWPSSTAPTITATASKADKYVFTADGTYWWGSTAGQNYL